MCAWSARRGVHATLPRTGHTTTVVGNDLVIIGGAKDLTTLFNSVLFYNHTTGMPRISCSRSLALARKIDVYALSHH